MLRIHAKIRPVSARTTDAPARTTHAPAASLVRGRHAPQPSRPMAQHVRERRRALAPPPAGLTARCTAGARCRTGARLLSAARGACATRDGNGKGQRERRSSATCSRGYGAALPWTESASGRWLAVEARAAQLHLGTDAAVSRCSKRRAHATDLAAGGTLMNGCGTSTFLGKFADDIHAMTLARRRCGSSCWCRGRLAAARWPDHSR